MNKLARKWIVGLITIQIVQLVLMLWLAVIVFSLHRQAIDAMTSVLQTERHYK